MGKHRENNINLIDQILNDHKERAEREEYILRFLNNKVRFIDFIRKCSTFDDFFKCIQHSMIFENLDLLVEEFIEGKFLFFYF